MAKDVVRSGVTFNRDSYEWLDNVVVNSKRLKIDKSEIINALILKSGMNINDVQELVMNYREQND